MTSQINGEQQEAKYACTVDLIPQGTWDRISPDGRMFPLPNSILPRQTANRLTEMHRLKYVSSGPSVCSIYAVHTSSWDLPSASTSTNSRTRDQVSPCNSHIDPQSYELPVTTLLPTVLDPRTLSHIFNAKQRLHTIMQRKSSRSDERITTTASPFPFTSISGIIDTPSQSTGTSKMHTARSQRHSSEPSPSATILEQDEPSLLEDSVSLEEATHDNSLTG
jgi:hypothetical protein